MFLTNTLEEAVNKSDLLVAKAISDEANEAAVIKRDKEVMVVLGNPPYKGISANRSEISIQLEPNQAYFVTNVSKSGAKSQVQKFAKRRQVVTVKTFIGQLLDDYKHVDGKPLSERKQWTNNDYVKFIRFAQWRIEKTGFGILAFITDNSYLDGPTFRGMRRSLMLAFDEIFIYDLHGKSIKKETALDGEREENVFDIMQGVSILLAVRRQVRLESCKIYHAELWGSRANKSKVLLSSTVDTTEWTSLVPTAPLYNFVPSPDSLESCAAETLEFSQLLPLEELFLEGSNGVQTSRDGLVVAFDDDELTKRFRRVRNKKVSDAELRLEFFGTRRVADYEPGDTREWSFESERKRLIADNDWAKNTVDYQYRPFDKRRLLYADNLVDWPRRTVFKHLDEENVAICFGRVGQVTAASWSLVYCTDTVCDHNLFYRGSSRNCPLFLYSGTVKDQNRNLFAGKRPNLSRDALAVLGNRLDLPQTEPFGLPAGIEPEDILGYVYAVLHSTGYRRRYAEFLKRSYPRIPITSDLKKFRSLATAGLRLIDIHLLRTEKEASLELFDTSFPVVGDNEVEFARYSTDDDRVWINQSQYFGGVTRAVWDFEIGGYQICEKWLKDRRERVLTYDDIKHWQEIVAAINGTMKLMHEIDALIPEWPLM